MKRSWEENIINFPLDTLNLGRKKYHRSSPLSAISAKKKKKKKKKKKLERSEMKRGIRRGRTEQTVEHQSHWLATCNRPGRERVFECIWHSAVVTSNGFTVT